MRVCVSISCQRASAMRTNFKREAVAERERGRGRASARAYTIFDCGPYEWATLLVWATGSGCSVTKANGSRERVGSREREREEVSSQVCVSSTRERESIGI